MEPSRRLGRVALALARRKPAGRQQLIHVPSVPAPDEALFASSPRPDPLEAEAVQSKPPHHDRTVRRFLVFMIIAASVNSGAIIGLVGSNVLQEALRHVGLLGEPPIEAVQRKQAVAISKLDAAVEALDAALAGLSARTDFAGAAQQAAIRHMSETDDALVALRKSLTDICTAQAADPWRKPVAELATAIAKTHSEIAGLRASLDEVGRARPTEAQAIGARIDRLEQALTQHQLLGPIRGSIQESPSGGDAGAGDGHVLSLVPSS
jgi:hypothetical protein